MSSPGNLIENLVIDRTPAFMTELLEYLGRSAKRHNQPMLREKAKRQFEEATMAALEGAYMHATLFRGVVAARAGVPPAELSLGDMICIANASTVFMTGADESEFLAFVQVIRFAWDNDIIPSELATFIARHGGVDGTVAVADEEIGRVTWG